MKPVKCSVAAVVRNPRDEREFLAVRRPPDDDPLPRAILASRTRASGRSSTPPRALYGAELPFRRLAFG